MSGAAAAAAAGTGAGELYGSRCVSEMAGSDRVKCHATCPHFFQLMADDKAVGGETVDGGRVVTGPLPQLPFNFFPKFLKKKGFQQV